MVSTTGLLDAPVRVSQPTSPILLPNHRTQSPEPTRGWVAVVGGVISMAIGTSIGYFALQQSPRSHSPIWMIAVFGGVCVLSGFYSLVYGIWGLVRQYAYVRKASERPDEPWSYDFQWQKEGIAFSASGDALKKFGQAVTWALFIAPCAWIGLHFRGATPFLLGVAIFGIFDLILWFRCAKMFLDSQRYGNGYLSYGSFPFFLGGKVHAQLRVPRNLSAIEELTLTFRCVREDYVVRGTRMPGNTGTRQVQIACYELFKSVVTYDRSRLAAFEGGEIPCDFQIPADQPPTTLAAAPATYWEIEANGKARGIDYEAVFLVPVYKSR
jgi:hypothetical protein